MVRALPQVTDGDAHEAEEVTFVSDAMTTDLYEVTMTMSYLREGMTGQATFSLFVRDLPPERGFLVAAGLKSALEVSHQTALASKAARCVLAAGGHPVVDFSLRRAHGPQSGFQAARLGAMVGFAGTSNVAAATAFGIPAVGTMAHFFMEAFATEEDAFRAFARSHPGPVTLLVDTYDTEEGVRVAARVLRDLAPAARGPGSAVRLDSGDLGALAVRARDILDSANLPDVRIIASGGLDEYAVDELVRAGAPIDTYAVGTRVGVSADSPFLDSAYKMVKYDGRPVMKLSSAKVTAPGPKQVFCRPDYADVIGLADEQPPDDGRPLLETVMQGGQRIGDGPTLDECRSRFSADLDGLPSAARRIRGPLAPRTAVSERLSALTTRVRRRIEEGTSAPAIQPRDAERTASGSHRSVPT